MASTWTELNLEDVYEVLFGEGTVKLGDELRAVRALDAIRIAAQLPLPRLDEHRRAQLERPRERRRCRRQGKGQLDPGTGARAAGAGSDGGPLAGPDGAGITGQVISVDGGYKV